MPAADTCHPDAIMTLSVFPSRRHLLSATVAVIGMFSITSCSGMFSGEQTIFIDGSKLQQKLDTRFPVNKRLLGMFDVTVSNPHLSFDPAANKLGTRLTLATPAMFGLMPAMKGNVDLAYGLRYEPSDHSVRMTQVEVKSVDLKDDKGQGNSRANNALAMLGEQMFQDYTLYKFTAADLEKASKYKYTPTTITVKRNGVDVLLVPRK